MMRFIVILFFFLISCGPQKPYNVTNILISPKIAPLRSIQNNMPKAIGLRVHDQRIERIIGTKRFGFEKKMPIYLRDIGKPLMASLVEHFPKANLFPKSYANHKGALLQVNILDIQFIQNARVISADIDFTIQAEVIAINQQKQFRHTYNVHHHDSDMMMPSATHQTNLIDSMISDSLAELVQKIVTDAALSQFLHAKN